MKLAIVGNLCQIGYIIAKQLRNIGYDVHLYITCKDNQIEPSQNPWNYDNLPEKVDWIRIYNTRPAISAFTNGFGTFSKYDKIIALTLSPSYIQFFNSSYYCIATGTDIREFVFQYGWQNFLLKRSYQKARYVFLPISEMPWVPQKLGIEKKSWFMATPIEANKINNVKSYNIIGTNQKLTLFYPTNWITTKKDRAHKGTEKFINACDKLFHDGYDFSLKIIDHNDNSNITHEDKIFVNNFIAKHKKNITIVPYIKQKADLINEYIGSDIIIDQFDLGIFGVIGLEAMCCKKPLLTYFSSNYEKYYDNSAPPIINCQTEDQIYTALKDIIAKNENESLIILGQQAYSWVSKYHDVGAVSKKIIEILNAF